MRGICLLSVLFLVAMGGYAQPTFHGVYGGLGFDRLYSVVECENGDIVAAGGTRRFSPNGEDDLWLIRTDSLGQLLWEKAYGSALYPEHHGYVAHRPGGGFYLVGQTFAPWNDTISLVVYALDGAGNVLWERLYGDYYNDPTAILSFPDGRVAITGSQIDSSLVDLGQIFLLVLDSSGNVLVDKSYGGPMYDLGGTFFSNGEGYVIAGTFDNRENISDAHSISLFLLMTDRNGDTLWTKKLTNPVFPNNGGTAESIIEMGSNRYHVIGDMTVSFDGEGNVFWIDQSIRGGAALPVEKSSFVVSQDGTFLKANDQRQVVVLETYPSFISGGLIQSANGGWILAGSQKLTPGAFDGVLIKTNCKGALGSDLECLPMVLPSAEFPKDVVIIHSPLGEGLIIKVSGISESDVWGFRIVDLAGRVLLKRSNIVGKEYIVNTTSLAMSPFILEWNMGAQILKRIKFLNLK